MLAAGVMVAEDVQTGILEASRLSQKPSKKASKTNEKKKLVIACNACRKKKVKCSGDRPACGSCLRLDIPCEYPLIKSRGSRLSYHELLTKRLQSMEKHILPEEAQTHVPIVKKLPGMSGLPAPDLNRPLEVSHDAARSLLKSYSQYSHLVVEGNQLPADWERIAFPDLNYPPPELASHLSDTFFEHVHDTTYSYIHKPSYFQALEEGTLKPALLFAICGISARFSNHPMVTQATHNIGQEYIDTARLLVRIEYDSPKLDTLQAIFTIAIHDFVTERGGRGAINCTLAVKIAQTLQLNRESPDPNLTWVERETRRRMWWSAVTMDRLLNSGPQRSFTLLLSSSPISLPCTAHNFYHDIPVTVPMLDWNYPESGAQYPHVPLDVCGYYIRAVVLWGNVISYVNRERMDDKLPPWSEYSEFGKLDTLASSCYARLPENLRYSYSNLKAHAATGNAIFFVNLHVVIQFCQYALYRCVFPYDYETSHFKDPPRSFVERAANKLAAAACAISTIMFDTLRTTCVLPPPFVGFAVYSTSSAHIHNAFSRDAKFASLARSHLTVNLKLLVSLRRYWPIVSTWCSFVKRRYLERAKRAQAAANSTEPDSVIGISSLTVEYGAHPSEQEEGLSSNSDSATTVPSHQPIPPQISSTSLEQPKQQQQQQMNGNYSKRGWGIEGTPPIGGFQQPMPLRPQLQNGSMITPSPVSSYAGGQRMKRRRTKHDLGVSSMSSHYMGDTAGQASPYSLFSIAPAGHASRDMGMEEDENKDPHHLVMSGMTIPAFASITNDLPNHSEQDSDWYWLKAVDQSRDSVNVNSGTLEESSMLPINCEDFVTDTSLDNNGNLNTASGNDGSLIDGNETYASLLAMLQTPTSEVPPGIDGSTNATTSSVNNDVDYIGSGVELSDNAIAPSIPPIQDQQAIKSESDPTMKMDLDSDPIEQNVNADEFHHLPNSEDRTSFEDKNDQSRDDGSVSPKSLFNTSSSTPQPTTTTTATASKDESSCPSEKNLIDLPASHVVNNENGVDTNGIEREIKSDENPD